MSDRKKVKSTKKWAGSMEHHLALGLVTMVTEIPITSSYGVCRELLWREPGFVKRALYDWNSFHGIGPNWHQKVCLSNCRPQLLGKITTIFFSSTHDEYLRGGQKLCKVCGFPCHQTVENISHGALGDPGYGKLKKKKKTDSPPWKRGRDK